MSLRLPAPSSDQVPNPTSVSKQQPLKHQCLHSYKDSSYLTTVLVLKIGRTKSLAIPPTSLQTRAQNGTTKILGPSF